MRTTLAFLSLFAVACGEDPMGDVAEGNDAVQRPNADGTSVFGAANYLGDFQVPYCAGSIPKTFADIKRDISGISLFGDGTYRAQVPGRVVGRSCAKDERCLSLEVGTWGLRSRILKDGASTFVLDHLVVRPDNAQAREYQIGPQTQALTLSRPSTSLAPEARAGLPEGLYNLTLLNTQVCLECADDEERFEIQGSGRSRHRCRTRPGLPDQVTLVRQRVTAAGGPLVAGRSTVNIGPTSGRVGVVRVQSSVIEDRVSDRANLFLEHGGRRALVMSRGTGRQIRVSTLLDDFFDADASGPWTLVAEPAAGAPMPRMERFTLTVLTR